MKTTLLTLALGASILTLAAAPAPSFAAEPDQTFANTVKYSDLNLASREGAKTMYQRIKVSAQQGCGAEPDSRDLGQHAIWRKCVNEAVDHAVGRLNAPMVTALNGGRAVSPVQLAQAH